MPATGRGTRSASACRSTSSALLVWLLITNDHAVSQVFFGWATTTDGRAWRSLLKGFWINVQVFLIAEVIVLVWALVVAVLRLLPGPACKPVRFVVTVYVDVFRGIPALLVISSSASGCHRHTFRSSASFSDMEYAILALSPHLRRLRLRGVPRRHRVDPLEPGRRRTLARPDLRPDDAPRRGAPGRAARDPAAAERLHRPAEGHVADQRPRRARRHQPGPVRQQLAGHAHRVHDGGPAVPPRHDSVHPLARRSDQPTAGQDAGRAARSWPSSN